MNAPPSSPTAPLVATYFARREDMRRFFSVRTGGGGGGDVEDLLQDLYLKIQRADVEDIGNPSAYLYRLASNLLLDRLRTKRRSGARDAAWRDANHTSFGATDIADAADAEAAVGARLRLERLIQALETLPPTTRRVFWLHKLDGLTHAETAKRLQISKSAVEKHVSLALKHLRVKVGDNALSDGGRSTSIAASRGRR